MFALTHGHPELIYGCVALLFHVQKGLDMGQLQVKILDTGAPVGLHQLVGPTVQKRVPGQKPVDDHIDSGVAKRDLLDVEKQRGTALDQLRMAAGQCEHHWWEGSVGEMNLPQLHQFKAAMIELRTKIGIRTDRIVHEQPANPFGYWVGKTSLLVVLKAGPSFAGGGGIGALLFGVGPGSFGAGGGGSDNNGIVPFDGKVPDADGSKAPYGLNHGYGRGFY
ncbi:hypothetical protein ACSBR1_019587 [Camellia fascicularis]